MGWACGKNERKRAAYGERDNLEETDVDRRVISNVSLRSDLSEDRDRWQALVRMIAKLRVP
jgi:hypothetical protein